MRINRTVILGTLFIAVWILLYWILRPAYRTERGVLGEAPFMYALPRDWDGKKLLMLAHGYVPIESPFVADFDLSEKGYGTLLENGWLVAKTAYRRNGVIIEDAMEDINQLLRHIESTEGEAQTKILQGSSMGGLIGILMMERQDFAFDGGYMIGPALYLDEPGFVRTLSETPLDPLLIVANQSEYERPERYFERAKDNGANVALWKISRNGHVNINTPERLGAVQNLLQWVQGGEIEIQKDGTVDLAPKRSGAVLESEVLKVKVTGIHPAHGNIDLDLIEDDLKRIGIKLGDTAMVQRGEYEFQCKLGNTYSDVRSGQWVLFKTAEGHYLLCQNGANAAETLGRIKKGHEIRIRSLETK